MLTPADAYDALKKQNRLSMDDPTELQPVRWYFDPDSGYLKRSQWQTIDVAEYPNFRLSSEIKEFHR